MERLIPYADAHHLLQKNRLSSQQLQIAQQRIPELLTESVDYQDFLTLLFRHLPFRFVLFLQAPYVLSKLYRDQVSQFGWIDNDKVLFLPIFSQPSQAGSLISSKLTKRLGFLSIDASTLLSGLYRSDSFVCLHKHTPCSPPYILLDPILHGDHPTDGILLTHFLDFFVNLAEWSLWMTAGAEKEQIRFLLDAWPSR